MTTRTADHRTPGRPICGRSRRVALAALLIACAVAAIYWQTGSFAFVFDDEGYLSANPQVREGLSWRGLRWAFSTFAMANWHPLAWLSHMLDVEVLGLEAGGHHLVNAALHAAVSVSLFLALRALTGAIWLSASVALLFAVHPLQVETVAWVSQRKSLLSALFFLAGCGLHAAYARRPSGRRLVLVAATLVLGLLSKPMGVSFPLVLLVLDFWPLGRTRGAFPSLGETRRLVQEKTPLFALAIAAGVVTLLAQRAGGALQTDVYPLGTRLANAVVAGVAYLRNMAWPADLAVFYPHPGNALPGWRVVGSLAALLALTAAALRLRRLPWLAAGWSWYVVTLLPVIGIVQVGGQAMADRYAYLPSVGLLVAAVWSASRLAAGPGARGLPALALCLLLPLLMLASRLQAAHWRDGASLYGHALEVTSANWLMLYNLGKTRARAGDDAGAITLYREAIRVRPAYDSPYLGLAAALEREGLPGAAEGALRALLARQSDSVAAHRELGSLLARSGRLGEAATHHEAALRLAPDSANEHYNLGLTLERLGRVAEAAAHHRRAVELAPGHALARAGLARTQP